MQLRRQPYYVGLLSAAELHGSSQQAVQVVQVQTVSSVPDVTVTPTSYTVNANPSVVAPNVDVTTNNRTEVRALFVDANNNAIPNMRVRFFASGGYGSFSTGSNLVYSDSNGMATTAFVPGSRTSPLNGVTIQACWSKTDFVSCGDAGVNSTTTTTLTVSSDPLSISIGTAGTIIVGDQTYKQQFVVLAVDAAGRAKGNVEIVPSVDLPIFLKGQYTFSGGVWVNTCTDATACAVILPGPVGCANEDIYRTGIYQAAQDINFNGQIDPRRADVVISSVGSTKTASDGTARIQIEYPKNVGSWLQYKILVSAGVNGTEGRATWVDILGVPINDVKSEARPAFIRSPYGVVTVSAVPSINPSRGVVQPCANAD